MMLEEEEEEEELRLRSKTRKRPHMNISAAHSIQHCTLNISFVLPAPRKWIDTLLEE